MSVNDANDVCDVVRGGENIHTVTDAVKAHLVTHL